MLYDIIKVMSEGKTETKFIFVTGGVVSGLGKGITAASLGRLLKSRGLSVTMQKLDPYLNIDPGNMSPFQHGEVFVTDGGHECDLDVGHYERFIDENLPNSCNITSGKIYHTVIERGRRGDYNGGTVQVIPHITNQIKDFILSLPGPDTDVAIVEIGGTVGDIEGLPFLEAGRQLRNQLGRESVQFVHVTLVPYIGASEELKTKPTQHSVKELSSLGIQPDILVCRTGDKELKDIKEKIALFCYLSSPDQVIENKDTNVLYEVPLLLQKQNIDTLIMERLKLKARKNDIDSWRVMVERIKSVKKKPPVNIALVGEYVKMPDAYLSINEALYHGALKNDINIKINYVDVKKLKDKAADEILGSAAGIITAGFYGDTMHDGMIEAVRYAREKNVPFFGISLGMHAAVAETAKNVLKLKDAEAVISKSAAVRLGQFRCKLAVGSKAREIYGAEEISERHRQNCIFNNGYRKDFEDLGFVFSGEHCEGIAEIIEYPKNDFFVGVQYHPEFKSRPNNPHPLFSAFIAAAGKHK